MRIEIIKELKILQYFLEDSSVSRAIAVLAIVHQFDSDSFKFLQITFYSSKFIFITIYRLHSTFYKIHVICFIASIAFCLLVALY